MEDQRVLHYFISSINNFASPQPAPQVQIVVEAEVETIDPNQISLLDQIADMEADQMDEDIRYAANEDVIQYTDPAGNTFESIDFHNAVTSDPEDDDDELNILQEQHIITIEEEPFEIDENQEIEADLSKLEIETVKKELDFIIDGENNDDDDDMSNVDFEF
jgi:hypothetical protein